MRPVISGESEMRRRRKEGRKAGRWDEREGGREERGVSGGREFRVGGVVFAINCALNPAWLGADRQARGGRKGGRENAFPSARPALLNWMHTIAETMHPRKNLPSLAAIMLGS